MKVLLHLIALVLVSGSCFAAPPAEFRQTLVVLIAGYQSDASPEQIAGKAPRGSGNSGMYQLMGDLRRAGFKARFFNWNGATAGKYFEKNPPGAKGIAQTIRALYPNGRFQRLVLIGHSWGGHTMLETAAELAAAPPLTVDLAIGVDPSSFGRGVRAKRLPQNVKQLAYYHTANTITWGQWKDEPRCECIDLGNAANGFQLTGGPNYASAFDLAAHNAVEWDERVHAAIVARVQHSAAAAPMQHQRQ